MLIRDLKTVKNSNSGVPKRFPPLLRQNKGREDILFLGGNIGFNSFPNFNGIFLFKKKFVKLVEILLKFSDFPTKK
jgi:hypothetical protein